jgi:hypothetical protein
MKQKELIRYSVVDVSAYKDNAEKAASFEAIELRGGGSLREIGEAFLFWRSKTREIVYRATAHAKAFTVFSLLDSDAFLRTLDVLNCPRWSDDDLESFATEQSKDTRKEIRIDMGLWGKSQDKNEGDEMSVSAFLRDLYSINPYKDRVDVIGSAYPFLFLLTLDWFASKSKEIVYNNQHLI